MSGMHWRYVGKLNTVSDDGRMLEGLQVDPDRVYPVIGRGGHPAGGVRLRVRGNDVQAKIPRVWRSQYSLAVEPGGQTEWREIDGRQVLVFVNPVAKNLGPGQHAWAPR
jgi:hypothetical protein